MSELAIKRYTAGSYQVFIVTAFSLLITVFAAHELITEIRLGSEQSHLFVALSGFVVFCEMIATIASMATLIVYSAHMGGATFTGKPSSVLNVLFVVGLSFMLLGMLFFGIDMVAIVVLKCTSPGVRTFILTLAVISGVFWLMAIAIAICENKANKN